MTKKIMLNDVEFDETKEVGNEVRFLKKLNRTTFYVSREDTDEDGKDFWKSDFLGIPFASTSFSSVYFTDLQSCLKDRLKFIDNFLEIAEELKILKRDLEEVMEDYTHWSYNLKEGDVVVFPPPCIDSGCYEATFVRYLFPNDAFVPHKAEFGNTIFGAKQLMQMSLPLKSCEKRYQTISPSAPSQQCPDALHVEKTTAVDDSSGLPVSWVSFSEKTPPLTEESLGNSSKKYIFKFADKEQFIVGSARFCKFNRIIVYYYSNKFGATVSKIYKLNNFSHWMPIPDIS